MSKIIDCSREVSLHEFYDCLSNFTPEWVTELSDKYEEYKKELAQSENIITIADLVKSYETVNGKDFTDIISVVIYKNGKYKYITCY